MYKLNYTKLLDHYSLRCFFKSRPVLSGAAFFIFTKADTYEEKISCHIIYTFKFI
jgi:hypothetical protein